MTETEEVDGEIITRHGIQTFDYLTPVPYRAVAIRGQPVPHFMFHRPLSYYFNLFFANGFILDGFVEPGFQKENGKGTFDWYGIPPVAIIRFKKSAR